MAPIIEVKNVSKQYLLGEAAGFYGNLREAIAHTLASPFRALQRQKRDKEGNAKQSSFWALSDVLSLIHI